MDQPLRAIVFLLFFFLLFSGPCLSSVRKTTISPGFEATPMNYIDNDGLFLHSNSSEFFFGFRTLRNDSTAFLLVVVHLTTSRVVWTANRGSPVGNVDRFEFGDDGNARLVSRGGVVWSTDTGGRGAVAMEVLDAGNLVILGGKGSAEDPPVWQSFENPTDTLLPEQSFTEGMSLVSDVGDSGLRYSLRISSGEMKLQVEFRRPQPYWSLSGGGGDIVAAKIANNSWNVYDGKNSLLSKIVIPNSTGNGAKWAAVLDSEGFIRFYDIDRGVGKGRDMIPSKRCDTPAPCGPYGLCSADNRCRCPAAISSDAACKPNIGSPCGGADTKLVEVEEDVGYFAIGFLPPAAKGSSDIKSCKASCANNCSCVALFFDESSGDCHLFDELGSLRRTNTKRYTCFLKISRGKSGNGNRGGGGARKRVAVIVPVSFLAAAIVASFFYFAAVYFKRRWKAWAESAKPLVFSDEDENEDFPETMPGLPVRFSYRELTDATNNFSTKLGQGGFGSVYMGRLGDGTRIAVKKLEGVGQGRKEFRTEVSTIGSIRHLHLVRLRGFCAEHSHRLLAYEFMANGSLDRWIFRKKKEEEAFRLDWDKAFKIALGAAKGLAYLHRDCDSKIVHCDVKPENVLLDDNFVAKVSDFGLAKLVRRDQSQFFTAIRGTRGYLAPEWMVNTAVSEKSDVFSFGMVLLEIIGGRKNFDPSESSEKVHLPSYAFKMLGEGRVGEVVDERLRPGDKDRRAVEVAVKVALWSSQEDVSLRPSMAEVVRMLEGVAEVPPPPPPQPLASRLNANLVKAAGTSTGSGSTSVSREETPSSVRNSDAFFSAVRLSGPR